MGSIFCSYCNAQLMKAMLYLIFIILPLFSCGNVAQSTVEGNNIYVDEDLNNHRHDEKIVEYRDKQSSIDPDADS